MDHPKDYPIGYKRPPTTSQFKKGRSGNPGGRRRKSGPVRVDFESILNETFQVSVAGRVQAMSAKEVEIRQILKRALEKKDFRAIAYLIGLFEKHGCFESEEFCGVLTLPTNRMPSRIFRINRSCAYFLPAPYPLLELQTCRLYRSSISR